jgi:hypothetical protein
LRFYCVKAVPDLSGEVVPVVDDSLSEPRPSLSILEVFRNLTHDHEGCIAL